MKSRKAVREAIAGYLFTSPVTLGILLFTAWPVAQSLYYSFTKFNIIKKPQWVGGDNYAKLTGDAEFWHSLKITAIFTGVSVPASLLVGFLMALLLNRSLRGIGLFRTIFYLPVVVPVVASGMLWKQLYSPTYGFANRLLEAVGLPPYTWFSQPESVLPSIIIMGLWQAGGSMIIWLAGFQGIPVHLYEAAIVDGASRMRRFWSITIPMITPVIFFNLIMGFIGSFQVFGQVMATTAGGPLNASNFLMVMIYKEAFRTLNMGYASALAWVLFVIVLLLTAFIFRTSRSWVHYEGGAK
ncbi:carbohydrate ABC transporter permease [Cohnella nanjingensis]|uniref:Sugar ABC transporter permease n=1 Tax=Cohnella nanjingensis TaxID=1387779 RepID=A0A7X0VDT0_9BACL|nr:sugar ABC transporter permease [Cohnella nanjingensis]MBB6670001.1 sugar ABC transporter permease [Cohnella nanjingensis]